jgi:flagellin-like protein
VRGRKNSGISPVVATVILVAVAIVTAIAVAFWASGLVGVFTRYEQLEVLSAYQSADNEITIIVANRGTTTTSIIQVVVNGIQVYSLGTPDTPPPPTIEIGARPTCTLTFEGPLQAGVTYMVELKTSGGKTYPTAVLATMGGGEPGVPNIIGFGCG